MNAAIQEQHDEREPTGTSVENTVRNAVEKRSIDWVPPSERHGKVWHQSIFWFMSNFNVLTVAVGFVGPSLGLTVGWTALAVTIGIAIGTTFMAFHATQGPRLGLPQMIQSRAQFGYRGVVLPVAAALFTYIAFNVLNQLTVADGMHSSYGVSAGLIAALATALGALLTFFGHDWLHRTFRVMVYITLPLFIVLCVAILTGSAGSSVTATTHYGFHFVGFMVMLGVGVSYNTTYTVYVSDYTRYLPAGTSSPRLIASVSLGAALSAIWMMTLGAWLSIHLGVSDSISGVKVAGNNLLDGFGTVFGIICAVAIVLGLALNGYGATLTLLTGVDSFREFARTRRARGVAVLVTAVSWYLIGVLVGGQLVTAIDNMTTLMLYLLIPWTATNLMDFFLVRRGHYAIADLFRVDGIYGRWGWRGLTAFAGGFAAEVPFMVLGSPFDYTGPGAKALSGVDISWAVGFVTASLIYLVLARSIDRRVEASAITESETELTAVEERP